MASARIPYSTSSLLGSKMASLMAALVAARAQASELHRIVEKYVDANSGIAADFGMPDATNVGLLRNLLAATAAELGDVTVADVPQGAQTSTRQLTDAMA